MRAARCRPTFACSRRPAARELPGGAAGVRPLQLGRGVWQSPGRTHLARIRVSTMATAPVERCFDLARSIDLHIRSATATRESAVAGVTSGLLRLGDRVTWRARHFGVWQTLTSQVTVFDRPRHFRWSAWRRSSRLQNPTNGGRMHQPPRKRLICRQASPSPRIGGIRNDLPLVMRDDGRYRRIV